MASTTRRAFLLILSLALFAGCSDMGDPVGPQRPPGTSLRFDVQPIFSARCAIPGCHVTPSPQAGMNLSTGASYANTVNVAALSLGPGLRVAPGDPDASVLYQLISSGTMPALGGPLTAAQIETIREWIAEGADNN
jgi:hypothetical protein